LVLETAADQTYRKFAEFNESKTNELNLMLGGQGFYLICRIIFFSTMEEIQSNLQLFILENN